MGTECLLFVGAGGADGGEVEDIEVIFEGGLGLFFVEEEHALGFGLDGGGDGDEGAVFDDHLNEGVFVEDVVGDEGELVDEDDVAMEAATALPEVIRVCF
jgi:hypothetical protein